MSTEIPVVAANKPTKAKVLIVDEDKAVLQAAAEILSREGYTVVPVDDAFEGLAASKDPSIDVAVLDIKMPNLSCVDLLRAVKQHRPDVEVIIMTACATVETAVEAVKAGAYDYLTKPFESIDDLSLSVGKAAERKALKDRTRVLEDALKRHGVLEVEDLPAELKSGPQAGGEVELFSLAHLPYSQAKKLALRAFERRYLSALLERSKNNVSSAARAAGVDRSNFRRLLKQYEVGGRSLKDDDGTEGSEGSKGGVEGVA